MPIWYNWKIKKKLCKYFRSKSILDAISPLDFFFSTCFFYRFVQERYGNKSLPHLFEKTQNFSNEAIFRQNRKNTVNILLWHTVLCERKLLTKIEADFCDSNIEDYDKVVVEWGLFPKVLQKPHSCCSDLLLGWVL